MSTQPITGPTTTPAASQTTPSATSSSASLDENEFLQLMVTQLKDQDPLNPTDTSTYLSQLAQFTSLEQETNTATNTLQLEGANARTEALSLLGQSVTYTDSQGNNASGVVTSVDLTGSSPTLTIGSTGGITTSQVQSVS
jgi:flagellar basal-body rod modification protein FlgD